MKFVDHDHPMVAPDFDVEKMHPADEPFWMIASPYDPDGPEVFLLDRAGMMELQRQIQVALAKYYEKFPLDPNDMPPDLQRPSGPKERT